MSTLPVPERLEAADVEAWVSQPGRRIVWFHAVWDGQGTLCLADYRALPLAVREIIPLRLVDMDAVDHPRAVQWPWRTHAELFSRRISRRGAGKGFRIIAPRLRRFLDRHCAQRRPQGADSATARAVSATSQLGQGSEFTVRHL